MKKLFKEERTVLKTGLSKFKIVLLFVLLSEIISPQIPFNGFCKLNSFSIDSGFTKIFSINYDQNEYSDLLVYNPSEKKALLYNASAGTKFITKKTISFPSEVSSIEPIIGANNFVEEYAFASRKNRSFGIYKFSTAGNPTLVEQIKLNSYPENISITNNKLSDYSEFLLSGNSFDGLSIISYQNKDLKEIKITQNRLFQNAQFLDINSDGYEDIAALNSIENKLHLFFNNSRDEYNELRHIKLDDDVLSMKIFDINYDQFQDVIISTASGVLIYFGDATASLNKSVNIKTEYPVDRFIIGDFNRDGFFDINYINTEEGIISTIFAKDFDLFYPEFIQKKKKGIVDVIPFFSKFIYGAAYLNINGEINILSKVIAMSDDQQLAIGIEPNLITSFDHINNGIVDLAFTDNYDKKLKLIIRSSAGLPEKLFTVNLYEKHNRIFEFSNSSFVKTFFLYSDNKKIIESIEIDFKEYSFKRKFHYADGPIEDFAVIHDSKSDAELLILYSKNKSLNLQVITKTPVNYNQKLYNNLSSNWFDAFLLFDNKLAIGYWNSEKDFLRLNFIHPMDKDVKPINKLIINDKTSKIISKSNHSTGTKDLKFTSLIFKDDELFLATGTKDVKLFKTKNTQNGFRIQDKNQLFFGKTNSVFLYNSKLSELTEFTPARTGNQLLVSEKFSDLELSNYTIQKLDQRNLHLIFTDVKSGNIEIRQLSR